MFLLATHQLPLNNDPGLSGEVELPGGKFKARVKDHLAGGLREAKGGRAKPGV